jgi:hypothetical protein
LQYRDKLGIIADVVEMLEVDWWVATKLNRRWMRCGYFWTVPLTFSRDFSGTSWLKFARRKCPLSHCRSEDVQRREFLSECQRECGLPYRTAPISGACVHSRPIFRRLPSSRHRDISGPGMELQGTRLFPEPAVRMTSGWTV